MNQIWRFRVSRNDGGTPSAEASGPTGDVPETGGMMKRGPNGSRSAALSKQLQSLTHGVPDRTLTRIAAAILGLMIVAGVLDLVRPVAIDTSAEAVHGLFRGKGTTTTLSDVAAGPRYTSYTAIRESAPGAVLIADLGMTSSSQTAPLDRSFLLALGRVASVEERDLSDITVPSGRPARSGVAVGGAWELFLADGPVTASVLLAVTQGEVLRLVDSRLVPTRELAESPSVHLLPRVLSPWAAGLVDAGVLSIMMLAGGLILPRQRIRAALRPLLALPVGVAALASVGIVRVPGAWSVLGAALLLLGLSRLTRLRACDVGWSIEDRRPLVVSIVGLVTLSVLSRSLGLFWASADSVVYLSQARLLAEGRLTPDLIRLKRGLAQQQVHAPGFAVGGEGLQSIGPVMLIVGVILLVAIGMTHLPRARSGVRLVPVLAGVMLLASPAIPVMAAYVNSHLLVGVLLLVLAVLLGIDRDPEESSGRTLVPAVGLVLTTLVLLRPEGTLLAGLVLLGTLRSQRQVIAGHWRWLGVVTVLWNAILVQGHLARGEPPARIVLAMLGVGMLLVLMPSALERLRASQRAIIPPIVGALLWTATIGLLFGGAGSVNFVDAAVANLGQGQGRWGAAGVMLLLGGLSAAARRERASDGPGLSGARWAIIGFIPLALLAKLGDGLQRGEAGLETLLSGGGRVGWGDSVNRGWTHAIFLIVLLVVMRSGGADHPTDDRGDASARAGWSAWIARVHVALIVVSAAWVASRWQPFAVSDTLDAVSGGGLLSAATVGLPHLVAVLAAASVVIEHPAWGLGRGGMHAESRPPAAGSGRGRLGPAFALSGLALLLFGLLAAPYSAGSDIDTPLALDVVLGTAGELVDGAEVRQTLDPEALVRAASDGKRGRICIDVLIATYLDRPNTGSLALRLTYGATTRETLLDVAVVADNSWVRACYAAGDITGRSWASDAELVIRGVGGTPGASVTAWMRPASPSDASAVVLGTASQADAAGIEVLVHRVVRETVSLRAVMLVAVASAAILWGLSHGCAIALGRTCRRERHDAGPKHGRQVSTLRPHCDRRRMRPYWGRHTETERKREGAGDADR